MFKNITATEISVVNVPNSDYGHKYDAFCNND